VLVLLSVAALLTSCGKDALRESDTGAPEFAGGGSGPSASGHVEHDLEGCCLEKYSFDAHHLGDGSVHGRFNVRDFFTDGSEKAFAKGRVTCFTSPVFGAFAPVMAFGPTVFGLVTVFGAPLGATVLGATVLGATVFGAILGATVFGAVVLGATVLGTVVLGGPRFGATRLGGPPGSFKKMNEPPAT
jgi:hypothetical protein